MPFLIAIQNELLKLLGESQKKLNMEDIKKANGINIVFGCTIIVINCG